MFMSGFSDEVMTAGSVWVDGDGYLVGPFFPKTLDDVRHMGVYKFPDGVKHQWYARTKGYERTGFLEKPNSNSLHYAYQRLVKRIDCLAPLVVIARIFNLKEGDKIGLWKPGQKIHDMVFKPYMLDWTSAENSIWVALDPQNNPIDFGDKQSKSDVKDTRNDNKLTVEVRKVVTIPLQKIGGLSVNSGFDGNIVINFKDYDSNMLKSMVVDLDSLRKIKDDLTAIVEAIDNV